MLDIREIDDINEIKPLWEALNRHHMNHSRHFKESFYETNFDKRMEKFKSVDAYRIEVLCEKNKPYGYVLACIDKGVGEIDSFYIYDDFRGLGLGEYLIKRMITWFETSNIERISVDITAGNEDVIMFYQRIGFNMEKYTMELGDKR